MEFLYSAIQITPYNCSGPMIITGKRHHNCLETIFKFKIDRFKDRDIQGFIILNDDKQKVFVDRYDGAQIAKELGYKLEYENCLFSEDIWPE